MKSLYARVNTAFESADPEDCKDYIQEMRANWYEIEKRLSRTVFLLILVALAGGIMIAGAVSQIELAGIQLKDLRIASTAAPILVSFLWLQTISLYTSTAIYEEVHLHLMHRTQPSITEEDLQSLLMPTTTVSAPPTLVLQDMGSRLSTLVLAIYELLRIGAIVVLPIAYLAVFYTIVLSRGADLRTFIGVGLSGLIALFAVFQARVFLRHAWNLMLG